MTKRLLQTKFYGGMERSLAIGLCMLMLTPYDRVLYVQQQDPPQEQAAAIIPNDQLDSLVAPIALYPDPLLSQVLVASTYPLEIIQLQQWLAQPKNKDLKGDALVKAVEKEDWDPSIQGMAALPDAVKQLAENIKWTTDLGNAFLAQQTDVMDAVQRMRVKAKDAGNLKSNEQMKVETQVVENKSVVVIQQASPEVIYVPSYNPTVVYGPPIYPYPPIYYPPAGYYAAGAVIGFGVGIAMGAAWGGGWGYGCGWGGNNNVYINNNNNFVNNSNRNNNINGGNRNNVNGGNRNNVNGGNRNNVNGGRSNWQHNPQHRGGAPYSNRDTANKFGGTARGDSVSNRQASGRQNQSAGGRQQAGTMDLGSSGRQPGNLASSNGGSRTNSRDANSIGNRQVQNNSGSRTTGSFGGSSNKAATQRSSSRGASSMGGSRGGARSGGGRRR